MLWKCYNETHYFVQLIYCYFTKKKRNKVFNQRPTQLIYVSWSLGVNGIGSEFCPRNLHTACNMAQREKEGWTGCSPYTRRGKDKRQECFYGIRWGHTKKNHPGAIFNHAQECWQGDGIEGVRVVYAVKYKGRGPWSLWGQDITLGHTANTSSGESTVEPQKNGPRVCKVSQLRIVPVL
jgi:hypothetical protein